MRIEIAIIDDNGQRRVVAHNDQLMPEGPGGHRPRLWDVQHDPAVIRSMSATEHWAASHLLLNTASMLMIDPQHVPNIAAVAAYQAARKDIERDERAALDIKVKQGILRAQERLVDLGAEAVRRGRTVADHARATEDTAELGADGDLMFVQRGHLPGNATTTEKKE